jgi:hypothetical protein
VKLAQGHSEVKARPYGTNIDLPYPQKLPELNSPYATNHQPNTKPSANIAEKVTDNQISGQNR